MVLFFDDSSMTTTDQPRARAAAAKFVDANAGPDRAIAIVNSPESLRITQNFTTDAERLSKAVSGKQDNSSISRICSLLSCYQCFCGLFGPDSGEANTISGLTVCCSRFEASQKILRRSRAEKAWCCSLQVFH